MLPASRRQQPLSRNASHKVRFGETPKPALETSALPERGRASHHLLLLLKQVRESRGGLRPTARAASENARASCSRFWSPPPHLRCALLPDPDNTNPVQP